MDKTDQGNFLISREEQRVFKHAAAMIGDMELIKVLAHYRAIRQTSSVGRAALLRIKQAEVNPLMVEVNGLNELVHRPTIAVKDMRYVYGPLLAGTAITTLAGARNNDMLNSRELPIAECVIESYKKSLQPENI